MFQSTVNKVQAAGVVGEIIFDGPHRAEPNIIRTATAANNVIGRAFTAVAGQDGVAEAGGTGVFAGILADPHVYALQGSGGSALAPSITLANESVGELVKMGTMIVSLSTAGNIGDDIHFVQATGVLLAVAAGTAPDVGNSVVPNTKVVRQNVPAAGLAFIQLTN